MAHKEVDFGIDGTPETIQKNPVATPPKDYWGVKWKNLLKKKNSTELLKSTKLGTGAENWRAKCNERNSGYSTSSPRVTEPLQQPITC